MEKYLIIAGTEKSGTTSVFEYLSTHPEITSSKKKETDYFRKKEVDLIEYNTLFNNKGNKSKLQMESSPAYLGLSEFVFPRIQEMLKDQVKIIVMTRDPIDRLISSFLFHKSKYYIDDKMHIDEYVRYCLDYSNKKIGLTDTPFKKKWFLDVLAAGKYSIHIEEVRKNIKKENIFVRDICHLKDNPKKLIHQTCEFLNIDNRHFDDFDYYQANKQFTANNKLLHIVAMKLNSTLEVKLRRSPKIKQKLLTVYKSINKKKNTTEKSLSPELIQELREYYCNEYKFMKDELDYKYDEVKWKNFE
ncbi:MAG: sulfotransferase domain-containing protein [Glaciecola sp.]|nr:sulfotransferase domain-containing protein [Glaciecola sp.]MDG1815525.1 sulfotransferase domain-containing protein [Glaciecola sp.]MDG2099761.1 sulfotransferase domain-containing protein [Glaciecola sp.]